MELFPDGDGIFIDICFALVIVSTWAQAKMEAQGSTGPTPKTALKFTEQTQIEILRTRQQGGPQARSQDAALLQFRSCPPRAARHPEIFHPSRDRVAADRLLGLRAFSASAPAMSTRSASSSSA